MLKLLFQIWARKRSCSDVPRKRARNWFTGTLALALLVLAPAVFAETFVAYGPQAFYRNSGAPVTETAFFTVHNPNTNYQLQVYNGGLEDDDITGELVSSGKIYINGTLVVGSNNFNKKTTYILEDISLTQNNEINVELRGKPGGVVVIVIIGEDNELPVITSSLDIPPNPAGWHKDTVTVSFTCDDVISGIKSCTDPIAVATEGQGQTVTGTAEDHAGNIAQASEVLNIDKTQPQISHSLSPLSNTYGWYNTDVSVNYTCTDSLSGVALCPSPHIISTEGEDQAFSATAVDVADNTNSTSFSVNIDKTAPQISATITPAANPSGWHNTDVIVTFTCSDDNSGVEQCPNPITINTETTGQVVTGTVKDHAGNSATTSVAINVDKTVPEISTAVAPLPNANGWHNGDATITFSCSDERSGVVQCPEPVIVNLEAASQVVESTVFDVAGNSSSSSVTINLDKTAPVITASVTPLANDNGWHNSDVTVTFTCTDENSGVAVCPEPVLVSSEGANQVVSGTVEDNAGNSSSVSVTINLDKSVPQISTTVTPAANANGWHNSDATVTFSCSDENSGVVQCPEPVIISLEGASQVVEGTVFDVAGNSSTATATINLDKTLPEISQALTPSANSHGWYNTDVLVDYSCSDTLSGIAVCPASQTIATVGMGQIFSAVATDNADNSNSTSFTLNVDKTAPVITADISPAANEAGWHNSDVTITFSCSDDNSGVVECPQPATVNQEAANQAVSGAIYDKAGNSNSIAVTINLDKTAPVINATVTPLPNENGWHDNDVTVTFTCTDENSGVAVCPEPILISSEGANQVISGTVEDVAGNSSSVSVTINLDKSIPQISATVTPAVNANGWHNSDITVDFSCIDAGSGVVTCPEPVFVVTEAAIQVITGTVEDVAGNSATTNVTLKLDKTPPVITADITPPVNSNGWHNSDVSVAFTCGDENSGVANCSEPVIINSEGADQVISSSVTDFAGNSSSVTTTVSLDKTAPLITATVSPPANANGWHNSDVTISFTCSDNGSGVLNCPEPVVVSAEGADQVVSASVDDLAGNRAEVSVSISLDKTAPDIVFASPADGEAVLINPPEININYSDAFGIVADSLTLSVNGQVTTATCNATASGSSCTLAEAINGASATITAAIHDIAGNTSSASVSVILDTDGDGVPDVLDAFPNDPSEWADLDGDGIGDNSDPDRDGDGINNDYETQLGTDPSDATSTPPDLDGDGIPNSLDDDRDGDGVNNLDELQFGSNPDDGSDLPVIPPPTVTVDGGGNRVTDADSIRLTGRVEGGYPSIVRTYASSDRLGSVEFAVSFSNGVWQTDIPLELGSNLIRVVALDGSDKTGSVEITVERRAGAIIDLLIDQPTSGAVTTDSALIIKGRVVSEVPIDTPQVIVNGQPASVSQGQVATEYAFQSQSVSLTEGNNLITVAALIADKSLQRTVTVSYQPQPEEVESPQIFIRSPQPGTTLNTNSFTLLADILTPISIQSITLNGQAVGLSNGGVIAESIIFPEGAAVLDVTLVVTDTLGQSSSSTVRYQRDADAPVIHVNDLSAYPTENTVAENPYTLSGLVSDQALSQLLINDQAVALEATSTEGSFEFNVPLALTAGSAQSVVLTALDDAGNSTSLEYLLAVASDTQIEWIQPANDSQLLLGEQQTVQLSARVLSSGGEAQFIAYAEGQRDQAITLNQAQGILSGDFILPASAGTYTLWIEAQNSNGEVLARASRTIEMVAGEEVVLEVVKVTPEDGTTDMEANGFLSIFFNKPIELALLSLEVNETLHGFSYVDADPSGVDGLVAKGYVLQEINRDYELVPGVVSLLPNATGVTFYPERDLGYSANIYITANYDGEEMVRQQVKVRPRPTFIEGVVLDNLGQPVANVEVSIPVLERTASTNADGAYTFGYGDSAERNIPSGRYQIMINRGLKHPQFGSYRGWINVQNGTRNTLGSVQLALANPDVPINHLQTGTLAVVNGGEVKLDLSDSRLLFADGRAEGAVRMQFLPLSAISVRSFDPRYTPLWVYAAQPVGIEVSGDVLVDFALPTYQGSYDYAPRQDELVVLLGLNADGTALAPVGVGKSSTGHRIVSLGETYFNTLDYIAYARVIPDQQSDLMAYADGNISLEELLLRLQIYQFVPPRNEQEALERLQ